VASNVDELFAAIAAGDVDRVRGLLDAEPSLADARDHDGVSALMRARYRLDPDLTHAIRSRAGDLDVFEAAAFADDDRVERLLDADPSLATARSADGFTALHLAAFFGGTVVASLLLAHGAEVDAVGSGWMTGTALHSAASASHADVAEMLLQSGADPNARQDGGWMPLHAAAANGDVTLVRLLRRAGADASAANDDGRTPRDVAENDMVIAALGEV